MPEEGSGREPLCLALPLRAALSVRRVAAHEAVMWGLRGEAKQCGMVSVQPRH